MASGYEVAELESKSLETLIQKRLVWEDSKEASFLSKLLAVLSVVLVIHIIPVVPTAVYYANKFKKLSPYVPDTYWEVWIYLAVFWIVVTAAMFVLRRLYFGKGPSDLPPEKKTMVLAYLSQQELEKHLLSQESSLLEDTKLLVVRLRSLWNSIYIGNGQLIMLPDHNPTAGTRVFGGVPLIPLSDQLKTLSFEKIPWISVSEESKRLIAVISSIDQKLFAPMADGVVDKTQVEFLRKLCELLYVIRPGFIGKQIGPEASQTLSDMADLIQALPEKRVETPAAPKASKRKFEAVAAAGRWFAYQTVLSRYIALRLISTFIVLFAGLLPTSVYIARISLEVDIRAYGHYIFVGALAGSIALAAVIAQKTSASPPKQQ